MHTHTIKDKGEKMAFRTMEQPMHHQHILLHSTLPIMCPARLCRVHKCTKHRLQGNVVAFAKRVVGQPLTPSQALTLSPFCLSSLTHTHTHTQRHTDKQALLSLFFLSFRCAPLRLPWQRQNGLTKTTTTSERDKEKKIKSWQNTIGQTFFSPQTNYEN